MVGNEAKACCDGCRLERTESRGKAAVTTTAEELAFLSSGYLKVEKFFEKLLERRVT